VPDRVPPFEELYREFLPRIYAYVKVQVGTAADAEDVTSQVFMNAFRAYGRYRPQADSPAAWLFRIARNATLDHHRRATRRERGERAAAEQPVEPVEAATVVESRQQYRELMEAVARLPERQREVISLRHTSQLSFAEVGILMGCSEDAAKMLYHRALKALRVRLGAASVE
jgi:RNA polymerase sigma-70 factor (ECF subfamily)